ncbi:MFS transporter [Dactylosporangium sp. CA-139114]|uniref:MFS transporter n=1 Tax=Dactylosporangium sp. CA-139114 TaxID=3239931 RepID=UPI003D95D290
MTDFVRLPTARLFTIVLASSVAFFVVLPLLPLYLADHAGDRQATVWTGPVIAASFAAGAIFAPVWGSLSDRYGARRMMIRAAAATTFTQLLLIVAHAPIEILAVRIVHGCVAGLVPAAMTYGVRTLGAAGKSLASLSVARSTGALLGPGLGGVLAATLDFRAAFAAAALLTLLATGLAATLTADTPDRAARRRTGLLTQFRGVVHERHRYQGFGLVAALAVFAGAIQVVVPVTLQHDPDLTTDSRAMWVGIIFTVSGGTAVAAGTFWGMAADRYGWRSILPLVTVGSALAIGTAVFVSSSPPLLLASLATHALISCEAGTLVVLFLLEGAPEDGHGMLLGLNHTVTQLGLAVGPLLAGAVIAATSTRWVYAGIALGFLALTPAPLWRAPSGDVKLTTDLDC